MYKRLIRIALTGLLVIYIYSCEKDGANDKVEIVPESSVPDENTPPRASSQSFEIEENAMVGLLIGKIVAEDSENDKLQFTMNTVDGLVLDNNSGELTTAKGAEFLDYETTDTFEFEVSISDGKNSIKTKITLIIIDVEDGPLTNFEKDIITGFKHQILSNSTDFPLFKRSTTAKIYYSGAVTPGLKAVTSSSIQAYNEMFTDGFKIELVNDSLAANVQLYSSTVAELKQKWPGFGELADENPGIGGIAEIGGGRIWIADYAHNKPTMLHEMGHMIGLLHAPTSQCGSLPEENSIMCGGVVKSKFNLSYQFFNPNNFSPSRDNSAVSYFVCSQFLGSPGKA